MRLRKEKIEAFLSGYQGKVPNDPFPSIHFKLWLECACAEILDPMFDNELVRFRFAGKVSSVTVQDSGNLKFSGVAGKAYEAFIRGRRWIGRRSRKVTVETFATDFMVKAGALHKALVARDGRECFYCAKRLGIDATIEHMLAIGNGGTSEIENLVLACQPCNQEAADMPIIEKVKMRDKKRGRE